MCSCCSKNIQIGQQFTECNCPKCPSIIHTKCYKKSEFKNKNDSFYCKCCAPSIPPRYNPFSSLINQANSLEDDSDRFYNLNFQEISDVPVTASNILKQCNSKTSTATYKQFSNEINFSTFFYNIDGNKSNFDQLTVELAQFDSKFSVIGLAETNTEPDHKQLFPIDNYNSFYNDIMPGKSKGTGVALYIHKSLNAVKNKLATSLTPNMESLFVSLQINPTTAINVGVVYRPPNGAAKEFHKEFETTLHGLPKGSTYIMGDFNLDLLKPLAADST